MASGRRVSLASLASAPVEDVPGHSAPAFAQVKPTKIAPTPLNSRINFGTAAELGELGESMRVRQLQPVVVVGRADYLRIFPEHADEIGGADYVLVNGERRLRAALKANLPLLDAMVRPQIADSRTDFLDALFTENLDRKNLDPIEEAQAVEAMVAECGTAKAAAEKFRRHESWVSQRRALLRLSPALQGRVRSGELPVRIARTIAALPESEQETAWRDARAVEEAQRTERAADAAAGKPTGREDEDFTAVKIPGHQPGDSGHGSGGQGDEAASTSGPHRGKDRGRDVASIVPWDSPADLARIIQAKLTSEAVRELVSILSG